MKVKLPEPINCNSYEFVSLDTKLSKDELNSTLASKLAEINTICNDVYENKKYSFMEYQITMWEDQNCKEGKYLAFIMGGSFFLNDKHRKRSSSELKERCMTEFNSLKEDIKERDIGLISFSFYITLAEDVIMNEVEAFDPFN